MPEESFEISLGSAGTHTVEVERSQRVRRMILRVLAGARAVVVVPANARGDILGKAREFAEANALWLKRALEKSAKQNVPAPQTLAEYFREHPQISAFGKTFSVEIGTASLKPFFVFRRDSPIAVICIRETDTEADLEKCLRELAANVIPAQVRNLAELHGVSVGKITVRGQRSRWGSCTAGGNLSLNWRLLLLPPDLQNHVILHELAHRVHMNHSGEFWDLLNAWDAETGRHDRELSRNFSALIDL